MHGELKVRSSSLAQQLAKVYFFDVTTFRSLLDTSSNKSSALTTLAKCPWLRATASYQISRTSSPSHPLGIFCCSRASGMRMQVRQGAKGADVLVRRLRFVSPGTEGDDGGDGVGGMDLCPIDRQCVVHHSTHARSPAPRSLPGLAQ